MPWFKGVYFESHIKTEADVLAQMKGETPSESLPEEVKLEEKPSSKKAKPAKASKVIVEEVPIIVSDPAISEILVLEPVIEEIKVEEKSEEKVEEIKLEEKPEETSVVDEAPKVCELPPSK